MRISALSWISRCVGLGGVASYWNSSVVSSGISLFCWAQCIWDREMVWLISCFVWFTWERCGQKQMTRVNGRELFGFMKFKYKEARNQGRLSLIPGLL